MYPESVSFDRAVDYYDQTRGFPPGVDAEVAQRFVQAGNLTTESRVLEIGAGTGRIAVPLAPHVGAYYGIDLATSMLGRLRDKLNEMTIYVVQGDATQLPYATASFDAVIAVHVFHLIPGWRDVLNEIARVLKAGGVLLHGGGQRSTKDRLDEVWRAFVKPNERRLAQRADEQDFLNIEGWTPVGKDRVYRYSAERAPQEYLDGIRKRVWSSCWDMSDEAIEAGYQALKAYIDEHHLDPAKPMKTQQAFRVRAYRPPIS